MTKDRKKLLCEIEKAITRLQTKCFRAGLNDTVIALGTAGTMAELEARKDE